jgi:hypothetical protein
MNRRRSPVRPPSRPTTPTMKFRALRSRPGRSATW